MLSNFKLKIISWYTLLLIAILAATLFGSYKLIGYQFKQEIIHDIKNKTESIESIINEGVEINRELSSEHGDEREKESDEHPWREYNYSDLQLYTEVADDNYILFVFKKDKLDYQTKKYIDLNISKPDIASKEIKDIEFNDISFSMTSVHERGLTIYFGYELSALTKLQNRLLNIFLIVFPIGVLLSFICGIFVTQRSMNVINKISETTKKITTNNLSERIEVPKGKDEITLLITTLNSMIDRLESSFNQAKQLSQDTAHEIRTPLTIIRGEIETLIEDDNLIEDISRKLKDILEEVQYLSSISNRLLLMHIKDTNEIKYNFAKISLTELMKSIYQDALVISNDRNLNIDLDIEDDIELECNKELITRLLWNITDNAIKYNNPNGLISFKLYKENSKTCIQISDTGIGISKKEISKIFDRFYRVDKSRSRQSRGSGLGLAICKWITDLHNASIHVESELDKGSKFTIIFSQQ